MEPSLRLRLVFKDPEMLTQSQRTQGLKRAWISVNQTHQTISQLSDHLINVFQLRNSCPNGLLLSMDGFVLPPFESTSILNQNDIICVKRKRGGTEIARLGDEINCCELKGVAAVNVGMKLLANEEFEKETGGYKSDSEEGEPEKLEDIELAIEDTPNKKKKKKLSKKRKATEKLTQLNGRKKRKRSETTEEASDTPEDVQKKVQLEQNGCSHQQVENGKSSDTNDGVYDSSNSDIDERKTNVNTSTPDAKRSDQIQVDAKTNGASSSVSKKFPSRSTLRRRLRRKWLIEKRQQQRKEIEMQLNKADNHQPSGKSGENSTEEHEQLDISDAEEGDIVPVEVRPGHIRFEPLGKANASQTIPLHENSVKTTRWNGFNGITNKKKGQKWGKEKTGFNKWSDQKNQIQEPTAEPVVEEGTSAAIEFDKLTPCATLPQVGDTVAYRLIELTSSWTPELSSFRVGKISKFDPGSDAITLVQVPEYPIVFEEHGDGEDDSVAKSNVSLYGDDGSLQIEYYSLADVRIVKHGNKTANKGSSCIISRATAADQRASSSWPSWPDSNKGPKSKKSTVASQEKGKDNAWDEICDTLSAKKAQLTQEDNWAKKVSTSQASWSNRGLRGSAIGPIMSRLRAQNEL